MNDKNNKILFNQSVDLFLSSAAPRSASGQYFLFSNDKPIGYPKKSSLKFVEKNKTLSPLVINRMFAATLQPQGFPEVVNYLAADIAKKTNEINSIYKVREYSRKYGSKFAKTCGCYVRKGLEFASVKRNAAAGVHWTGLTRCGLSWVCPVCYHKKMVVRRAEIANIIQTGMDEKKSIFFMTLTIRHTAEQTLEQTLKFLSNMWRKITKSRKFKGLMTSSDFIKLLEINKSLRSGWHPHLHLVWFSSPDFNLLETLKQFQNKWIELTNSELIRQDLQQCTNNTLANYLSKYDLAYEMSNTKKSSSGLSVFTLMKRALITENNFYLRALINEFEVCTKGVQQHTFSKNLRAITMTDEQVLTVETLATDLVVEFSKNAFFTLISKYHLQGEILKVALNGDYKNIIEYLRNLCDSDGVVLEFLNDQKRIFLNYEIKYQNQINESNS